MLPASWVDRFPPAALLARVRAWFDGGGQSPLALPDFQDVSFGLWRPTLDLCELTHEFVVRVELAGLAPEEVEIRCDGGILTVAGTREESRDHGTIDFPLRERHFGSFSRSIRLPPEARLHDHRTSFSNGLLTIRIPKRDPAGRLPLLPRG